VQNTPQVTFLYYRVFEEGRIRCGGTTLQAEFRRLEREGARFSELVSGGLPSRRPRLVLVFQTAPEHAQIAANLIRTANRHGGRGGQTSYGYTFTRNDGNSAELRAWRRQWRQVIFGKCRIVSDCMALPPSSRVRSTCRALACQ